MENIEESDTIFTKYHRLQTYKKLIKKMLQFEWLCVPKLIC